MTKAQIVQRLLDTGLINAEEAVILLQPDSVPFHTVTPPAYSNPYWTSTQTGVPSFSSNPSEYYRDSEDI